VPPVAVIALIFCPGDPQGRYRQVRHQHILTC
jgi:hypothetical protein